MAQVVQVPYKHNISVPIMTAQTVQGSINNIKNDNPISLESLGLLTNLLSYPDEWELYKTELYKRYAFNKERSVKSAWDGLVAANYIIEFKYRKGSKYEYVYYLRKFPFSSEEKAQILSEAAKKYDDIEPLAKPDLGGLQNADPKTKSSKRRGNQVPLTNQEPLNKSKTKDIHNIDDDKRTSPSGEDSTEMSDESIDLIVSNFREETVDELTDRSFKAIVRKVVDKQKSGSIGKGKFRDYLATALFRKIEELELRRDKEKLGYKANMSRVKEKQTQLKERVIKDVPFYNWLEN